MPLRVYNTLTKTKEPFKTVKPNHVGMYLCGMTVYKSPHIGHLVGPVIFDAVKRHLLYRGYSVNWVVNFTDVDDKLIAKANELKTTVEALAQKYSAEYLQVMNELDVHVDQYPKASEHIGEMIRICRDLIDKGLAYAAEGNVWFDVTKDSDYGKLSNRRVEEQESGLRTTESAGKRNPADFALWKAAKPGEPAWDSPWGKGRPGWHIECSAMSHKHIGPTLDIHGGGMDLLFPHHENELAQSESWTGQPLSTYWMHNGLTKIATKSKSGEWKTEDMHASTGNIVPARQLLDAHGPELLRYFLLSTHYRSPIEFTDEALANSKKALAVFHRLFERVERLTGQPLPLKKIDAAPAPESLPAVAALKNKFLDAMDDDFNTAAAIAALHELAGEINAHVTKSNVEQTKSPADLRAATDAATLLRALGHQTLGLFTQTTPPTKPAGEDAATLDKVMQLLITLRADARKSKNFPLADAIRKGLDDAGLLLEDRPDGTLWRKK